jgi:hypothetical protein
MLEKRKFRFGFNANYLDKAYGSKSSQPEASEPFPVQLTIMFPQCYAEILVRLDPVRAHIEMDDFRREPPLVSTGEKPLWFRMRADANAERIVAAKSRR